jgi:hypothetical protein
VTYAFLISLVGTAGALVLAFIWRAQRDLARGDVKIYDRLLKDTKIELDHERAAARSASKAWAEEKVAYDTSLKAQAASYQEHFLEFEALVKKCGSAAVPVLLPWIERVLSGKNAPGGTTYSSPDEMPTPPGTARARGLVDKG